MKRTKANRNNKNYKRNNKNNKATPKVELMDCSPCASDEETSNEDNGKVIAIRDIRVYPKFKNQCIVIGVVSSVCRQKTKNNKEYIKATIEDATGILFIYL